ncbi:hypothetical protein [Stutzerimonas stutzeri]|uniref:hypothetical protein n=1 Tax=Stutzerimonas stutzeri TaxID=316 RepID=UPI0015E3DB9A|nr:hypothetical protein [Stutzerimonas stutzeri]MBA1280323.1 hypothetical protein [Stutzerimonas stutzeri]
MRNDERTFSGCPVLSDSQIASYMTTGEIPVNAEFLEVPPGKVVRQRGFWLRPSVRMHHTAIVFLVSSDVYEMNEDELANHREQIHCCRSPKSNTAYLGSIKAVTDEHNVLLPLMPGLHEPLHIDGVDLIYVGRVIAAC